MPKKPTYKAEKIKALLREFPNEPTRAIARIAHERHPRTWSRTSRAIVRYWRGEVVGRIPSDLSFISDEETRSSRRYPLLQKQREAINSALKKYPRARRAALVTYLTQKHSDLFKTRAVAEGCLCRRGLPNVGGSIPNIYDREAKNEIARALIKEYPYGHAAAIARIGIKRYPRAWRSEHSLSCFLRSLANG